MAARKPPFLSLLLGLLFSCLLFHQTHARSQQADKLAKSFDADFTPTAEQRRLYIEERGNDIVHEIWSVLRDVEPSWKDSAASRQPAGSLETMWHYTKIVFRLLFMNTPSRSHDDDDDDAPRLSGNLKVSVDALKTAAAFDDPDAIFLLAEFNFYGNFSHPRNMREAFRRYQQLADLDGNSTAHQMLGLMYATGIGGVKRDQAKAMLHHTFAAEQFDTRSEMILAYRHHAGIGTPRDCPKAVHYYKRVADKAMDYWLSGPPGGRSLVRNAYRWVEATGGIYGEGASVSSSGSNAARQDTVTSSQVDYVLDYLDVKGREGDFAAILTLGKHYYEAPRGYRRNLNKARQQFLRIAKAYWMKDGKANPKAPDGLTRVAGTAATYLGRMSMRGEGMEVNYEKARVWFKRGVELGNSFAQYHMGIMYRDGLGVPQDGVRAGSYLKAAAEQALPIAQSALGVLFLDQGDVDTAGRYFELAAGQGVTEAFYYLAELTDQGVGRERNCGLATVYYKVVAEKVENIHSSFLEANTAYESGDFERAYLPMLMAAEQGYESAQANVAYLLDRESSVVKLPALVSHTPSSSRSKLLDDPTLALAFFTRSAKQANVDSLLKMGDYYLTLHSTSPQLPPLTPQTNATTQTPLEKATTCFTTAAENYHSAQALWNLGWMHEYGIGSITKDYHMAKRYYDLALEMNKEAYLPVTLALYKLRLKSWWNGVTGGSINGIKDEEEVGRPKNWKEWLNKFLDNVEEMDAAEAAAMHGDEDLLYEPGMAGGDENYAERRDGTQDVYGADEWEDFDDGLVESLIIIALAGALALLVYARQMRQRERERQQAQGGQDGANAHGPAQQNQGQGRDGGFFPPPGNAEFANWVAGGVGH